MYPSLESAAGKIFGNPSDRSGCELIPWRSGDRLRGLQTPPGEVGERPKHARHRREAPCVGSVADSEVRDERRDKIDGESGISPLFEPRGDGRKQQRDAEELGPGELDAEIVGKAEMRERLRD